MLLRGLIELAGWHASERANRTGWMGMLLRGLGGNNKEESLFYLMMPLEHIDFSYRLLDIKHVVIVTHSFRGNPLSPQRLLFPVSSKGSFISTFPQTGQHIPHPLIGYSFQ